MTRKLPKASAEATRDAAIVLAVHPSAEALYDRENHVARVCAQVGDNFVQLGMGSSAESAWRDAASTVTRPPVPELPNRGSPTWSLKSDEVFWNAQAAQSMAPVAPSEAQRAGNNAGNEGEADLSKLKM